MLVLSPHSCDSNRDGTVQLVTSHDGIFNSASMTTMNGLYHNCNEYFRALKLSHKEAFQFISTCHCNFNIQSMSCALMDIQAIMLSFSSLGYRMGLIHELPTQECISLNRTHLSKVLIKSAQNIHSSVF
ncbi:hypothetical protein C0J52_05082 [Blattella germanica]|nr:hypothetical protein C0J52_05082 [Blattella germanica]